MQRTTATAENVRDTTGEIKGYVSRQREILESEKNRKALEAGYQTGAVLNSNLRLLNRTTIPRINRALDSTDLLIHGLADTNRNFGLLVTNLDRAINIDLLPQTVALLKRLDLSVEDFRQSVDLALKQGELTLEGLAKLTNDPSWQRTLINLEASSAELVKVGANTAHITKRVGEASDRLPEIADSLNQIAKTSSRYSKLFWLGRIIAVFASVLP